MICMGVCEYRGMEERSSKQTGNRYMIIKFEDDKADQFSFYCPLDNRYKVDPRSLKRGTLYDCVFDYHMDSYAKSFRMDLYDITGVHRSSSTVSKE